MLVKMPVSELPQITCYHQRQHYLWFHFHPHLHVATTAACAVQRFEKLTEYFVHVGMYKNVGLVSKTTYVI